MMRGRLSPAFVDWLRGRRDAQGLNDGVDAYQRPLDRVPIKRIAFQLLKLGIV